MMDAFTYHHRAMATMFEIRIADQSPGYAQQAASAAFLELDRLESELSRFIESSDIGRANRLAEGETITIGDETLECLLIAADVSRITGSAFDVAYASRPRPDFSRTTPLFILNPSAHTLTSHAERLHLDLGAIGKGYALDRLAAVLHEWGVTAACLASGGSTVLALAPPEGSGGWPVAVGDGTARRELLLANAAVSCSGIAVQGSHLINPATAKPAERQTRVWSFAATAAVADALSTAFFVLDDARVDACCRAHHNIGAVTWSPASTLRIYGSAFHLF